MRVWLLLGQKTGDNAQVRALAEALGAPAREFELRYNWRYKLPNNLVGGSLATLRADPGFAAPWPDLVIGVGQRSAPVGRWIAEASGGRTKLVWLGRPRAPLDWFALVVTTPQYGLREAPNVLRLSLPFGASAKGRTGGRYLLASLGGASIAADMDAAFVDRFAAAARAEAAMRGLALRATTSPRSPTGAGARLAVALQGHAEIYDWRAAGGADNPYRDWLAEAGAVIATGESVSLIADAVGTGAPVALMSPPDKPWVAAIRRIPGLNRWLSAGGLFFLAPPPNIPAIAARFEALGLARREGELLRIEGAAPVVAQERRDAVARVRTLLAG